MRKISVEEEVINALKSQHARISAFTLKHKILFHDHGLVFPRLRGGKVGYPYRENLIEGAMDRMMKQTGIHKHLTPHSLRHTHVSLSAEAGVSLDDIKARVGHKDDKVTDRIHMHVTKNRRKNASEKFGAFMREKA